MSEVSWGQYAEAYKALHDKLAEILAQLSTVKDPTKYLPVRLSDGSVFYTAGGASGGGLVQSQIRNAADTDWVNEPYVRSVTVQNALDVIDKADRLLGRVYGSQGQQLRQRASTSELLVQVAHEGSEVDPRQIRPLTGSDTVTVDNQVTRDASGHAQVDVLSQTDPPNLDVALSTRLRKEDLNLDGEKDLQVDVKACALPLGAATETTLSTLNCKITACNTGNVAVGSALPSGSNKIGKVDAEQATRTSLKSQGEREDTVFKYFSNAFGAASDYAVLSAVSGQKHKIYGYGLCASADIEICLRDGTSSTAKVGVRAKSGHTVQTLTHPFVGAASTALNCRAEGAVTVKGWVQYVTEA